MGANSGKIVDTTHVKSMGESSGAFKRDMQTFKTAMDAFNAEHAKFKNKNLKEQKQAELTTHVEKLSAHLAALKAIKDRLNDIKLQTLSLENKAIQSDPEYNASEARLRKKCIQKYRDTQGSELVDYLIEIKGIVTDIEMSQVHETCGKGTKFRLSEIMNTVHGYFESRIKDLTTAYDEVNLAVKAIVQSGTMSPVKPLTVFGSPSKDAKAAAAPAPKSPDSTVSVSASHGSLFKKKTTNDEPETSVSRASRGSQVAGGGAAVCDAGDDASESSQVAPRS